MLFEAVYNLRPDCSFKVVNDKLIWLDDINKKPSSLEIDSEVIRLKKLYDNTEYQRLRKKEYDKLNQYEMQYDDLINNTTTWQDKIQEIKDRFPKPTGI
ncbi:hypothetical protein Arnit_1707 [Arcobacter nitrofigilis DSM 7299]|uniref:Uncharacterized protein n=1 Tax=Arcobacter nitrofigilis (strain ATCC 33309 / DSM 7299 / CCUG 15893 / LMG 7604 / NCTC 12251 / CI) TaxID=572480 RepID=D5UZZ2_ARCNC|nr:hypothetical protein [Arcobacter nitrofigilis]ADG93361.1 hypothetical protein Arnit_1707 [Arcobacter nitrofigilis DSM 7299]